MNYNKPKLQQMLAAEYALGTLHGRARRRFERLLAQDAVLRRIAVEWQQRLAPLDYVVPPVTPSERVWQNIEQRIKVAQVQSASAARPRAAGAGWWQSLAFWRGLGLATSALAAALLLYIGFAPQPPQAPSYIAVLADTKAQPAVIVRYVGASGELHVNVLNAQALTEGKVLELWALPPNAQPRSLGLLPPAGRATLKLVAEPGRSSLIGVPALAVSLEPVGGSPTGAPTGPVLYSGALLSM